MESFNISLYTYASIKGMRTHTNKTHTRAHASPHIAGATSAVCVCSSVWRIIFHGMVTASLCCSGAVLLLLLLSALLPPTPPPPPTLLLDPPPFASPSYPFSSDHTAMATKKILFLEPIPTRGACGAMNGHSLDPCVGVHCRPVILEARAPARTRMHACGIRGERSCSTAACVAFEWEAFICIFMKAMYILC